MTYRKCPDCSEVYFYIEEPQEDEECPCGSTVVLLTLEEELERIKILSGMFCDYTCVS